MQYVVEYGDWLAKIAEERCPPGPAQLSVRMECRSDADCLDGDVCCVNGPALLCGKQCLQKVCTTDGDCEGSDEAGPGECVSNGLLSACR